MQDLHTGVAVRKASYVLIIKLSAPKWKYMREQILFWSRTSLLDLGRALLGPFFCHL